MYYVYVLVSEKNNRLYIGHTNDLDRRIFQHNSGKSKYTNLTKPFRLVYSEVHSTRSDAMRREKALKGGQGRTWIKKQLRRSP